MIEGFDTDDFVLQGIDPITETVSVEWRIRIADVDRLREILGSDCDDDRDLERTYYDISNRDMRRIGRLCRPSVVPDRVYTTIGRPSSLFHNIPYMIHTGFELPLMLEGRKPLTVFSDGYPSQWFDDYLAPFAQFVATGRIIRRIVDATMPHLKERGADLDGIRNVFFALPGEEWRIDAYLRLMDTHGKSDLGWSDSEERLQGSLLGYEDWQNDWWIEQRMDRPKHAAG